MNSSAGAGPSCSTGGGSRGNRYRPYSRFEQTSKETSLTLNTAKQLDDKSKLDIDEGKRLIVGSVEQVVRWCRILSFLEPTKIIYQVLGIMESVRNGSHKCEKIFCLRSELQQSRIVCVFYEIDRRMPDILKGSLVLCTGHVKGKNKLQIFTLRELTNKDKNSFDRISLVSQWTINDILMNKKV